MQFLASSAAFNEPQAPDLVWNEHMTMLSYQNTVVNGVNISTEYHKSRFPVISKGPAFMGRRSLRRGHSI